MQNKMAEVAKLFGKELGESFTVKRREETKLCVFTHYGVDVCGRFDNPYLDLEACMLKDLLTGEAVIVDD